MFPFTHPILLRPLACLLPLLAASFALFAAGSAKFVRQSDRPILAPSGSGWESAGTFNPAVIRRGERMIMLYRAQDTAGRSRIGYAESGDGVSFVNRAEPVLVPETD